MTTSNDRASAVMDGLSDDGDEFAAAAPPPHATLRGWRAGDQRRGGGDVALGDLQESRAAVHQTPGAPDPRRTNEAPSGFHAAPEDQYAAAVEVRTNTREDVAINPRQAPPRPRGGSTGADPTRIARFQFAGLIRRFDQAIAHHPPSVDKIAQDNPTAARPPERKRLTGGRPNSSGTEGTARVGIGTQRNTFRRVPSAHDETIITSGAQAPSNQRAKGWRL